MRKKTVRIGGNGGNERSSDRALAVVQVRRGREGGNSNPSVAFSSFGPLSFEWTLH